MWQPPESVETKLDATVVATLVENHRAFLAFLEKRLGDRALAEDILQDAFVRSVTHADTIRDDTSAIAWFYQVLRNAVIDHRRRNAAASRKLEALASELATTPAAETELANAVCRCVGSLADTLEPSHAEAIRSVELEGMAVKDYALKAGITASNAGVRLHRARAALRTRVRRTCGTCADHGCLDCTCRAHAAT